MTAKESGSFVVAKGRKKQGSGSESRRKNKSVGIRRKKCA